MGHRFVSASVLVLVTAAGACNGDDQRAKPALAPVVRTPAGGSSAAPAKAAGSSAADAAPAPVAAVSGTARLAAGPARLGCVAWSSTASAAACVIGSGGTDSAVRNLVFVGAADGAPVINLPDVIDEADANAANAELVRGGYQALAGAVTTLRAGDALDLGNGVVLRHAHEPSKAGAASDDASGHDTVVAICGGKTVQVASRPSGIGPAVVTVRALAGHALVEVTRGIDFEGDHGNAVDAMVLDLASCAVASAR